MNVQDKSRPILTVSRVIFLYTLIYMNQPIRYPPSFIKRTIIPKSVRARAQASEGAFLNIFIMIHVLTLCNTLQAPCKVIHVQ